MSDDKKKLEIVSGDGKDLDISPVYEHLNNGRPKCNEKPKNIVIPEVKKEDEKEDNDENE